MDAAAFALPAHPAIAALHRLVVGSGAGTAFKMLEVDVGGEPAAAVDGGAFQEDGADAPRPPLLKPRLNGLHHGNRTR